MMILRSIRKALIWLLAKLTELHRPRCVFYEPTGAELIQALRMTRNTSGRRAA